MLVSEPTMTQCVTYNIPMNSHVTLKQVLMMRTLMWLHGSCNHIKLKRGYTQIHVSKIHNLDTKEKQSNNQRITSYNIVLKKTYDNTA
jgi:hypothetical protein